MSLSRLLKKKENGEGVRLLDYIDKGLRERNYFDIDVLRTRVTELNTYLSVNENEEVNTDELNKKFFGVWDSFFSDHKRTVGFIHPSQLKDACDRKQVYELLNTPPNEVSKKISPQLQRIFDQGTFFHLYVQNLLWRAGVLVISEAKVKNKKRKISGSTDGIIVINGKYYLLEIKTITTFHYNGVKLAPKQKHVYQATIYAKELQKKYNLEGIIFLYINKDSCEISEHRVEIKKKFTDQIDHKIDYLLEATETGELPERVCEKVNDGAGCPYQNVCFNLK